MIIITGTPGTGKTTIAKELGKALNLPVFSELELISQKQIGKKNTENEFEVELELLEKEINLLEKDCIVEGHLLCELKTTAGTVIVLRCEPKKLEKRLLKRHYKTKKVNENICCELIDYCLQKAEENHSQVISVDTSNSLEETLSKTINAVNGKFKGDNIDWSNQIAEFSQKQVLK
ncbi:MAG: AAA family ATPase [Candidatus Diapherotrites archaeon]|nr:AAA family ATPase [Candidatus Diapherotrites archaeon]